MLALKSARKSLLALGGIVALVGCSPAALTELERAASTKGRIIQTGFQSEASCDAQKTDKRISQLLDESYYLSHNLDVFAAVKMQQTSAISHFLCYGQYEKRKPNMLYDEDEYLRQNQDVAVAKSRGIFRTGFEHFAEHGQNENRRTMKFMPIWNSPNSAPGEQLFNEAYYLETYPAVKEAVAAGTYASGMAHYIQVGQRNPAMKPSLYWNEARYLNINPDVKARLSSWDLRSGLQHYLEVGFTENGRVPFDIDMFTSSGTVRTLLAPKLLALQSGEMLRVLRSDTPSGNVEVELLSATGLVSARYVTPYDLIGAAVCDFQVQFDDLSCVLPIGAQSGKVEVHTLTRSSGYRTFNQHAVSAITLDDAPNFDWQFRGGDLVAIKRTNVESGFIEVHIMTRATDYQQFIVQVATPICEEEGVSHKFLMAGNDLLAIKVQNTGGGQSELSILTGESTYSQATRSLIGLEEQMGATSQLLVSASQDLLVVVENKIGSVTFKRLLAEEDYK